MTREEFERQLISLDFHFEREEEFHRDVFDNFDFRIVYQSLDMYRVRLVIYVDRYTVRMVWWLDDNHKLTKSYYMHKEVKEEKLAVSLITSFVENCKDVYKVDLGKYRI